CSYNRELLAATGGFPEKVRAGEDTMVNTALFSRGYKAYRAQDVTLIHHSPCRNPFLLVRHHFQRGRTLGRIMLRDYRHSGGLLRDRSARSNLLRYVPLR